MLYLIGGVTRSGKTTLRNALLRERGVPGTCTDHMREALSYARPQLRVNANDAPRKNMALMEPHVETFLAGRVRAGGDFVFEGDAIGPASAAKFAASAGARSVFLLYPEADAAAKVAEQRAINHGWVAAADDNRLRATIETAIEDSRHLRDQCLALNVPYIDTSRLGMDEVVSAGLKILLGSP